MASPLLENPILCGHYNICISLWPRCEFFVRGFRVSSIILINTLLRLGANVTACDPVIDDARNIFPNGGVRYAPAPEVLKDADAAILVTEWDAFKNIDWSLSGASMRRKIVFDGRNVYAPDKMKSLGFEYYCIGRNRTVNNLVCLVLYSINLPGIVWPGSLPQNYQYCQQEKNIVNSRKTAIEFLFMDSLDNLAVITITLSPFNAPCSTP
jgi:hypothetical protein